MIQLGLPAALIVSYLLGAIPFALLVGRALSGVDVRRSGSGNVGTMNTFRTAGRLPGVLVALLDGLKAAVAMWIGKQVAGPQGAALCGAAAVAGHCVSPYLLWLGRHELHGSWKHLLRLSGGKGLASGLVVIGLIDWRALLILLLVFIGSKLLLRSDVTWPTVIGLLAMPPVVWWLTRDGIITLAVTVVGALVIVKHLPDLRTGFWVGRPKVGNDE